MADEYRIAQLTTLASVRTWGIRKELIVSPAVTKVVKVLETTNVRKENIFFIFN